MSNFLKVGEGLSFLKLPSAPSSPTEGMVYYDDTLNVLRYYDGTQWIDLEQGGGGGGGGATGGGGDEVFYLNDQHVTSNYSIPSGRNAMSAGPITIDPGVTVTVPSGSEWTIV